MLHRTFSILALTAFSLPSAFASSNSAGATDPTLLATFIGDTNLSAQIFDLNQKAGTTGHPAHQPWSGSYWPLHAGSIANPYDEGGAGWFNNKARLIFGVKANYRHFENRMEKIRAHVDSLDTKTIDDMAPSEKYDLYLGDHDFSLTHSVWQSVMEQQKFIGHVGLWEGTCHGWATASMHEDRPEKAIEVMSLDGKYLIPFYPDDLKGLATLLWGNSLIQDHTVAQGMRCQSKNPDYDPKNGKVLNMTCQGVNAGDFHTTILEMVGVRKQSLVVNRTNNTQVWNQPVAGYELKYFNPQTNEEGSLESSIVDRSGYRDPFLNYRAANAKSIVGVNMVLLYSAENDPDHKKTDTEKEDKIKRLKLHYDLELDADHKIVGGEWRGAEELDQNSGDESNVNIPKYPGFIWKFASTNPTAFSIADNDIQGDDPTATDRASLIQASKKASQFRYIVYRNKKDGTRYVHREELRPQPLGKVVNALIRLSHPTP
jgi:hypothetical protein